MADEAMRQVLIRMPADLAEALAANAKENDRTIAATVRRAVKAYLDIDEFRKQARGAKP